MNHEKYLLLENFKKFIPLASRDNVFCLTNLLSELVID